MKQFLCLLILFLLTIPGVLKAQKRYDYQQRNSPEDFTNPEICAKIPKP